MSRRDYWDSGSSTGSGSMWVADTPLEPRYDRSDVWETIWQINEEKEHTEEAPGWDSIVEKFFSTREYVYNEVLLNEMVHDILKEKIISSFF